MEVHTPAKLNLFLEVLGKRSDGYHELETLMVAVNICDTLVFSPERNGTLQLTCRWATGLHNQTCAEKHSRGITALEPLPPMAENLAFRAVRLMQERWGVRWGASMELVKRIPAAAGLGGASSDAAAALVAANEAWKLGLSRVEMSALAADIGSDVPFFLGSGAAICTGRGEKIAPLARARRLPVVVVRPPVGLSTRNVYRHCRPSLQPRRVQPLVRALSGGNARELRATMFNRLQEAARELSPWIDQLQGEFEGLGCEAHQMTGSGSSYFGICHTAARARRLAGQLRARNLGSVYCAATVGVATGREFLPQTA